MSEPSTPRPVPGPGRPVPPAPAASEDGDEDRFAELAGRPVAEHAEVFEAEHDRLRAELGTIDRV